MKAVSLCLFLALVSLAAAQSSEGARTSRLRLYADNPAALAERLERLGFDVLEGETTDASVDVVALPPDIAALRELGFEPQLIARGRPLADILAERPLTEGSVPTGYRDLQTLIDAMTATANAFPAICQLVDLTDRYGTPLTFEGRRLYALKISDNVDQEEDEPAVLVVSCHHAREIVTPELAMYAIDQLTSLYGSDVQITEAVDGNEIWIAPIWNPDGYNHVFTVDNLWRKNRRDGFGVDLNRNYPFLWSTACSGSTSTGSQTYKGPSAGSEPETLTMMAFSADQRFAKVIDYHSSGREALWAYACPTHPFDPFLQAEAMTLSTESGYLGSNRPPSADGEHYQWQLGKMGAHAFLIETQTQFQPSFAAAIQEAELVWPGVLWMLERPISISGHVVDADTNAPLEALVELVGVAFGQGEENHSGGPFGRYHVFAPEGNYELRFSADGYATETRMVNVVNGVGAVVDVPLSPLGPACEGDLNGVAAIEIRDLAQVVGALGQTGAVPEDLTGDGLVDGEDVLAAAAAWGGCILAP